MTWNEAEERAGLLWQNVARISKLRYEPECWMVSIHPAVPPRAQVHFLDAHGHPTCHPECVAREAALGADAPS